MTPDWRVLIIIRCDDASIIGRRGTKRKVEEAQEKHVKEKKDKKSGGDGQEGLKVVIEHWWVLIMYVNRFYSCWYGEFIY